jgi:hypothetical protein
MASFSDVLNKPSTAVEAPKALPVGTYLCIVSGQPEIVQRGQKGNHCVDFNLQCAQAQPDVDQQALIDSLKGASLSDKKIRHTLWVTDDAAWRLKQFLVDHLGVEEGSKTLGEMIPESMGKQVLVTLGHRASQDGTQIYAEVKGTAKV